MSILIKWVLVLVVVGLGYHWWRSKRNAAAAIKRPAAQPASDKHRIREMATCRHCGLHADREDMVRGALGLYCSDDHCRAQGDERR